MLVFHENLLNAVIERGGDGKETPMYYIRSLYLEKRKWLNYTLFQVQVDYD